MILDACELMKLVGFSPSNEELDSWLTRHRIYGRPFIAAESEFFDEDRDRAARESAASEIEESGRHSIAIIYDRGDQYLPAIGANTSCKNEAGSLFVLREIAFFGQGVQGYRGFMGQLPFNLIFGSSAIHLRSIMGNSVACRRIHGLWTDLWFHQGWVVNCSYLDGEDNLGVVHLRRPHLFDQQMCMPRSSHARIGDKQTFGLLSCLGQKGSSPIATRSFEFLGWDANKFDLTESGEITNFLSGYGVTMYFGDYGYAPDVLTGVRFNRLADMGSAGYRGVLPFDIRFSTRPDELVELVGSPPTRISNAPDTGAFLWQFEGFHLHVMYSLIDFQVYRVAIFAPSKVDKNDIGRAVL